MAKPNCIRGNAFACVSVEHTLLALQHELIKEDKKLSRRDGNIYRLGHYLAALEKCSSPSPTSMTELTARIKRNFCEGFGPRERVLKAINSP